MESKEPTLSLEEIDALESAYLSSCQNLHQKARSAYSTTGFLASPDIVPTLSFVAPGLGPTQGAEESQEGRVLARWQMRLKDWEKIEQSIKKRILQKNKNKKSVTWKDTPQIDEDNNNSGEEEVYPEENEDDDDEDEKNKKLYQSMKKLNSLTLLMNSSDEYRHRLEAMALLKASKPISKTTANSWQASLRGGGSFKIPLGSIFSGLECEINPFQAPYLDPGFKKNGEKGKIKIVRQVNWYGVNGMKNTLNTTANTLNDSNTVVNNNNLPFYLTSKSYEKLTKRSNKEKLENLRPYEVSRNQANLLVISSTNLIDWAQESTIAYLDEQRKLNYEKQSMNFNERNDINDGVREKLEKEKVKFDKSITPYSISSPSTTPYSIEYNGSQDLFFSSTSLGEKSSTYIYLTNKGKGSVTYKWKQLDSLSTCTSNNLSGNSNKSKRASKKNNNEIHGNIEIYKILDKKVKHREEQKGSPSALSSSVDDEDISLLYSRELVKKHNGSYFSVFPSEGEILPGEKKQIMITFDSSRLVNGGVFYSNYQLEFFPLETSIVLINTINSSKTSLMNSLPPPPSSSGTPHPPLPSTTTSTTSTTSRKYFTSLLTINMKGHYVVNKENSLIINKNEKNQENKCKETLIKDILYEVLYKVRETFTYNCLDKRKLLLFSNLNSNLYNEILQESPFPGLNVIKLHSFLTIDRLNHFENLSHEAKRLSEDIWNKYNDYFNTLKNKFEQVLIERDEEKSEEFRIKEEKQRRKEEKLREHYLKRMWATDSFYKEGEVIVEQENNFVVNDGPIALYSHVLPPLPELLSYSSLDYLHYFDMSEQNMKEISQFLFPHKVIECFDEINENDLVPTWKYDLNLVLKLLVCLPQIANAITVIEEMIEKHDKLMNKAREKSEKYLEKLRKKKRNEDPDEDDDDDDEEEEEDEEEDEEPWITEDMNKMKRKYRLSEGDKIILKTEALAGEVWGSLRTLVCQELPQSKINQRIEVEMNKTLEVLPDLIESAIIKAQLDPSTVVPRLMSPYLTPEEEEDERKRDQNYDKRDAKQAWQDVLSLTQAPEPPVPAKGKKKIDPQVESEYNQKKIDYYHKCIYDEISNMLYEVVGSIPDLVSSDVGLNVEKVNIDLKNNENVNLIKNNIILKEEEEKINNSEEEKNQLFEVPSLTEFSTPREDDVKQKLVVFTHSGKAFFNHSLPNGIEHKLTEDYGQARRTRAPYYESAFPVHIQEQEKLSEQLVKLCQYNPRGIILLYDQGEEVKEEESFSINGQVSTFKEILKKKWKDFNFWLNRRKRKQQEIKYKKKEKNLHVIFISSFSQLIYYIHHIHGLKKHNPEEDLSLTRTLNSTNAHTFSSTFSNSSGPSSILDNLQQEMKEDYFKYNVPIFVVENLRYKEMIPIQVPLEITESDEESFDISVGKVEAHDYLISKWQRSLPHRVKVEIEKPLDLADLLFPSNNQKKKEKYQTTLPCDAGASINTLLELINNQKENFLWIDGSSSVLFSSSLSFSKVDLKLLKNKRMLDRYIYEDFLWCSILMSLDNINEYLSANHSFSTEESQLPVASPLSVSYNNFRQSIEEFYSKNPKELIKLNTSIHPTVYTSTLASLVTPSFPYLVNNLFTEAIEEKNKINSIFFLGGELRESKIKLIEGLINKIDTIFLTGEIALPFLLLQASSRYYFKDEMKTIQGYFQLVKEILVKVKYSKTRLVLPTDVIVASPSFSPSILISTSPTEVNLTEKIPYDGIDGDFETKVISFEEEKVEGEGVNENPPIKQIRGRILDLGPQSCTRLEDEFNRNDVAFIWGLPCAATYAETQNALKSLSNGLFKSFERNKDIQKTESTSKISPKLRRKQHVLCWGDGTCEWLARILDKDGDVIFDPNELNEEKIDEIHFRGDLFKLAGISYANRDSSSLISLIGNCFKTDIQSTFTKRSPSLSENVPLSLLVRSLEEEEALKEEEEDDEYESSDEDDE